MRKCTLAAVTLLLLTLPCMIFGIIYTVDDGILKINADSSVYSFTIGTSLAYAPVPNGNLLYGYFNPVGISTTHAVVRIEKTPVDMRSISSPIYIVAPMLSGSFAITGTLVYNGIDISSDWEIVNNPATGSPQDTAKIKYTMKNITATARTVALRLELDTRVLSNDGANISVDNGFNVITTNTVYYKSLNQIKADWWDYDIPPPGTPTLVGRGYTKNNPFDEPATEPDIMEVANWTGVSATAQWALSPAGFIGNDSAVVLWWCNGNETSTGFTLNPGQSISFVTYYGLNAQPLLTTPTSTMTVTPTSTMTLTGTITLTHTITETITVSPTITPTYTFSSTFTITPSITATPTFTGTSTFTATPSVTPTFTVTLTFTDTSTFTDTYTMTITPTITATPTMTPTFTATPSVTPTFTVTLTFTDTPTFTVTQTFTGTYTATSTPTITATPTITPTFTPTPLPLILNLKGNFPNPFIRDTQIVYKLSVDADVKIKIFDVSGEVVRWQEDIAGKAGYNSIYWDGKNRAAKSVASGVFIYRLEASTSRGEHASGFMKAAVVK